MILATLLAPAAASAQAPDEPKEDRPSIALLDIQVQRDDDKELAGSLGALLAERVGRLGAFDVITQDDVRRMISFDRMKVALSCENEASCLAEIGGALGARYLLAGSMSRLDKELVLSVTLIDIDLVKTLGRETVSAKGALELSSQLDGLLTRLLGPILLEWRGTLHIDSENEGASVFIDDRAVGVIPLGPLDLPAGRHRVSVTLDGWVAYLGDVDVPPKGRVDVEVALRPLPDTYASLWRTAALFLGGGVTLVGFGLATLFIGGLGGLAAAEATKWTQGKPTNPEQGLLSPVLVNEQVGTFVVASRVVAVASLFASLALMGTGAGLTLFADFPANVDEEGPASSDAPAAGGDK